MNKRPIIALLILIAIGAGAWAFSWIINNNPLSLRNKPRTEWIDRAIVQVAKQAQDPTMIATEINRIKTTGTNPQSISGEWFSPQLIIMKNGEWIACTNICRKENSQIHDIFVGRASNGKWYYSTYHFCIRLLVLTMLHHQEQPESIEAFAKRYYLKEFDGNTAHCLQKTWPQK
jgi:hypothetical protein